jgi:CubicO group peptidase (beta-lactamase class C family)
MRNNFRLFTKVTILTAIVSFAAIQNHIFAQDKSKKIDELMTLCSSAGQFNGSALVVENGKVIYRKSFGYANLEWNIPNTPDTKFRIGSITKSFTAILVLQLVEQGKLNLEAKITNYLPNFPKKTGDKITVNQLLTHTSGLPDYNNVPDFFRMVQSGLLSQDEILKRISEYDLLFEPGTKFGYSSDGYILLGAMIEKVTGKPYQQVLEENILNPLRMKNTGYSRRDLVLEKRASGYRKRLSGYENPLYYVESPAAGMYSTVDDLYLWEQALYAGTLLSPKYKKLMWSISPYGNAYGWLVSKKALERNGESLLFVVSEGAIPGFFAWTARLPKDKHLIVLLTNVRGATNYLPDISQAITNILYGKPYQPPKRSIAETLLPTITQKGIEAALSQYRSLKSTQTNSYSFAENELNSLGFQLLNTQKFREAIEILKLNVEAAPQSWNAYDSLGEAYMRSGNKELAITNYQKSVELNPQNANGIGMLKRLREK